MKQVTISQISKYLPSRIVTNQEVEERINLCGDYIPEGSLERLFGSKERRVAASDEQVSDLAAKAAQPIVSKVGKENIDLLLFAAACSDLIEPATSNIIQSKLGLTCPCMDVKNACNSFLNAIQLSDSLIKSGMYSSILIVNGEKLSDAINYNIQDKEHLQKSLAAFSLGDAGVAALMQASDDSSGLVHHKFFTIGKHWDLCTILGGGSMYPHDVSKNYFQGKTSLLRKLFEGDMLANMRAEIKVGGYQIDEIDHLVTHQVSMYTHEVICSKFGIPKEKSINVFEKYGNTAAASVPLALEEGIHSGRIQSGDTVLLLGFAAGISASVQLLKL